MARRIDRQRLVVSALVAAALVLIALGVASARTGDDAVPKITDSAVEGVFPPPGAVAVPPQSLVQADLVTGWRGVLVIDGQEIPTFDLVDGSAVSSSGLQYDAIYDPAQGTVSFTPRQGATIEALAPGDHRASVVLWRIGEDRSTGRTVSWSFKVG